MPAPSKALMFAAAIGVASLAFAGGIAVTSASATPKPAAPIVDVDAWSKTAPAPATSVAAPAAKQEAVRCNPWEVSDIAMEEVLREMQRRGWRPPRQGDAIASMVSLGVEGIGAADPNAPMPNGGQPQSSIVVLSEAEAEQLRTEQISLDQLIVEDEAEQAPS